MKFLISLLCVFFTERLIAQQYNTIHKEAANSATLNFVSANTKWGNIIKLFRPLAENGFFYTTIKYQGKSFTISANSKSAPCIVLGQKEEKKDTANKYITLLENGYLSITFPENIEDKDFIFELEQLEVNSYNTIINPHARMSIEQVFQIMNLLCSHIKIDTILVVRTLTEEEIDYQKRFVIPELNKTISEFPTPRFQSSSDRSD